MVILFGDVVCDGVFDVVFDVVCDVVCDIVCDMVCDVVCGSLWKFREVSQLAQQDKSMSLPLYCI